MNPREILNYLLPFLVTAGRYSRAIQSRAVHQKTKEGATVFHQALSDADPTVQGFVEVALLARFPEVSFWSEEYAQSFNIKYFPKSADIEVLLDPIDGTRHYLDGRSSYQIIAAVHDRNEIIGAVAYLPRLEFAYLAVKGEGASVLTDADIYEGRQGRELKIGKAVGPVLVFNNAELKSKLSQRFETIDLLETYVTEPGKFLCTDIIDGKVKALLASPCQAIDGGALCFIAQEAGCSVSDFYGKPVGNFRLTDERIVPHVVASANREIHEQVLDLIRS